MTTLAYSAVLGTAPRLFSRLLGYWTDFLTGIEEARAMAQLYQDLATLTDREREDIPRAVLAVFSGR